MKIFHLIQALQETDQIVEEVAEQIQYSVQDPHFWITLGGDIALSLLGLIAYVVFKVWNIKEDLQPKSFLGSNKRMWVWHFVATLVLAVIYHIDPNGTLPESLDEIGINLGGKVAFLTAGWQLARYAYHNGKAPMKGTVEQKKFVKSHREDAQTINDQ